MSNAEIVFLEEKLSVRFSSQFARLTVPWDNAQWSKSYRVEFIDGEILYLKGTPRSRPEAYVTSVLQHYSPNYIPKVIDEDLFPDHPWRWFLLENAGQCDYTSISSECAINAAYHLGRLQKVVCQDVHLAKFLPQCRADGLLEAVSEVCRWAIQTASAGIRNEIMSLQAKLIQSTNFFHVLSIKLEHLPSTCAHGDFWSGNIACREDGVSFIDWGDALWGVGSISIINLLINPASGELTSHGDKIWEAYACGWEKEIKEDFIQGSKVAALVASLVIDMEIAKSCDGTIEILPGLLPNLQRLADLTD